MSRQTPPLTVHGFDMAVLKSHALKDAQHPFKQNIIKINS